MNVSHPPAEILLRHRSDYTVAKKTSTILFIKCLLLSNERLKSNSVISWNVGSCHTKVMSCLLRAHKYYNIAWAGILGNRPGYLSVFEALQQDIDISTISLIIKGFDLRQFARIIEINNDNPGFLSCANCRPDFTYLTCRISKAEYNNG